MTLIRRTNYEHDTQHKDCKKNISTPTLTFIEHGSDFYLYQQQTMNDI